MRGVIEAMNSLRTLSFAIVAASSLIFSACAEPQPPIGAPGALPQSRAITTHPERGGSWMLPEPSRKSGDLIYVMGPVKNYIVSYSTGAMVATFDGPEGRGLDYVLTSKDMSSCLQLGRVGSLNTVELRR